MAVRNLSNCNITRKFAASVAILAILTTNSCSPGNIGSSTALVSGLIGAGAGAVGGTFLGEKSGDTLSPAMGATMIGAAGALVGTSAGAMMDHSKIEKEKENYYVRVPYEVDPHQKDIEEMETYIYESSSWGRNEVKPYEERYPIDEQNTPYQGSN